MVPAHHRVAPTGKALKRKLEWRGLPVHIEYEIGDIKGGWQTLHSPYGYIPLSRGLDSDHVDVFVGPKQLASHVYIIDLMNENGSFDEQKCFLGFSSEDDANTEFDKHYPRPKSRGETHAVPFNAFSGFLRDRANWGKEITLVEVMKSGQTRAAEHASHRRYTNNPKNKKKLQAKWKIASMKKSGEIKTPKKCAGCGATGKSLQAHHPNHSQKTRVTWYCRQCHVKHDRAYSPARMRASVKRGAKG